MKHRGRAYRLGLLCLGGLMCLLGCGGEFERVEEEAYRTDKRAGIVVQEPLLPTEKAGRPVPTPTPAPPIKERYEIPETCEFSLKAGAFSISGSVKVEAPEGNAMPAYTLLAGGFSQETADALLGACCPSVTLYKEFSLPYSKGELTAMGHILEEAAPLQDREREKKEMEQEAKALLAEAEEAPEEVERIVSLGKLEQRQGEAGTYWGTYGASLPEDVETVFEVKNLPLGEDGNWVWSFKTGEYGQAIYYRNKTVLDTYNSLKTNFERSGAKEVPQQDWEEIYTRGQAFLEEAGLKEDFAIYRIFEETAKNGEKMYLIDCRRLAAGIPIMENFGFSDMEVKESAYTVWSLEGLRLAMDEKGLCFFCWQSPMLLGEEIKLGELLPFPVIRQTMETLLKEIYAKEAAAWKAERLELCYRPRYTENTGAVLVPVWNLYGKKSLSEGNESEERLLLSISALTGEKMPYRTARGK